MIVGLFILKRNQLTLFQRTSDKRRKEMNTSTLMLIKNFVFLLSKLTTISLTNLVTISMVTRATINIKEKSFLFLEVLSELMTTSLMNLVTAFMVLRAVKKVNKTDKKTMILFSTMMILIT